MIQPYLKKGRGPCWKTDNGDGNTGKKKRKSEKEMDSLRGREIDKGRVYNRTKWRLLNARLYGWRKS